MISNEVGMLFSGSSQTYLTRYWVMTCCTHKVKNELHVVGCRVEKSKPIVKSRIGCATINIRNTQREQSHDKVYLYGQNSANNPNRTHNYVSGGKISLFEPEIIHHFTQKAYNPTAGIILYQSTTKNQQRKRKEEVEPASSTKCTFLWLGGEGPQKFAKLFPNLDVRENDFRLRNPSNPPNPLIDELLLRQR